MGKRDIKSDELVEESDSDAPQAKKAKKETMSSGSDFIKTSDGACVSRETRVVCAVGLKRTDAPLSALRRVTVKQYKKVTQIDLREFYTDKDSGEDKPGKKGISLNVEQWEKLKTLMPQIDAEIEKLIKG